MSHRLALEIGPHSSLPPIHLGKPPEPRKERCRFCGRTRRHGATFEKEAHVVPKSLTGATDVLSFEECDECNALGGEHEQHLCTLVAFDRIHHMLRNRRRRFEVARGVSIEPESRLVDLRELDVSTARATDNRTALRLRLHRHDFRWSGVVRAVLRMGLFLAPLEMLRRQLAPALQWLRRAAGPHVVRVAFDHQPRDDGRPGILLRAIFPEQAIEGVAAQVHFATGAHVFIVTVRTDVGDVPGFDEEQLERNTWFDYVIAPARPFERPTDDEVRERAHELWRERGCRSGRDVEDWLDAEALLVLERCTSDGEET